MSAIADLLKGIDQTKKNVAENSKLAVEDPALLLTRMLQDLTKHFQDPMNFIGGAGGMAGMMSRETLKKTAPDFLDTVFKHPDGSIKELYHGTSIDKEFTSFKKSKRGTFLIEDPKQASAYAKSNDSKGLKFNQDTMRYEEVNTKDRVHPVFAKVLNPYQLSEEDIKVYVRTENYAKFQREIMDKAKAKGHDAVIYPDGGIAIADPSQIISSITPRAVK